VKAILLAYPSRALMLELAVRHSREHVSMPLDYVMTRALWHSEPFSSKSPRLQFQQGGRRGPLLVQVAVQVLSAVENALAFPRRSPTVEIDLAHGNVADLEDEIRLGRLNCGGRNCGRSPLLRARA